MTTYTSIRCKQDWSQLPRDIFDLVLKNLDSPYDYMAVNSVCSHWRSMTPKYRCWIVFPCNNVNNDSDGDGDGDGDSDGNGEGALVGFVNLCDPNRKVRILRFTEVNGRVIYGSSAGWLITVGGPGDLSLLDPSTRAHIQLPQLTYHVFTDLPNFEGKRVYIEKAIVGFPNSNVAASSSSSSSSSVTDGVVMAMCFKPKKLAYFRLGMDQNWSSFEGFSGKYKDIVFYKDRFYAIRNRQHLFVISGFDGPSPTMEVVMEIPNFALGFTYHLVECSGHLLLVLRIGCVRQGAFNIYRVDLEQKDLVYVQDIGNNCLFADRNTVVSLAASDVPGCDANHIYYIHKCFHRLFWRPYERYEVGVFNIRNRTCERLIYCNDRSIIANSPFWYQTYQRSRRS